MHRPSVCGLLVVTFALLTLGVSDLAPPLEGTWQRRTSEAVLGTDVPVTRVLDLHTTDDGSVHGELVIRVKVSDAMPGQDDEVERRRVEGQYDPPHVSLKFYTENDELEGESTGQLSEDGETLRFENEDGDISKYTKRADPE